MKRVTRGGWHPEDIKAAIRKRGTTLSALATQAGLHESTVRNALYRPIPRADGLIAAFLDMPKHALWPDRYDAEGHRLSHSNQSRTRLKNTPRRTAPHRQRAAAS